MSLHRDFSEIENDSDRAEAERLYEEYKTPSMDSWDLGELRSDIIRGFDKPVYSFD